MARKARRTAYRLGLSAERTAALWLRLKGYRILNRRYRTPLGEIDIVAARGSVIAFIEVKARWNIEAALDSVTGTARRRITGCAELWLSRHPRHVDKVQRFDLVLIAPRRLPRHIVDAW